MSNLKERIDYGRYYCLVSIKTPNTLATMTSILVTIVTSVALGLSPPKYSIFMFAGILVLYFLAMFMIGIFNYKKDVNIPLLLTSNIPPLDVLKESMKKYKYTPWRIDALKREFGPSAFREEKLTTVEIPPQLINCNDDLWAISRTIREKIHIIGKGLIGLNNARFHLYVTEEIPTTIALITGILLGDEHANFTVYTGGAQGRIEKILDSESITGMEVKDVQVPDISKLDFVADIYDREGKPENEDLSHEEVLEIVKNGFTKFIMLVDLTPTPLNRVSMANIVKNAGADYNGFMVIRTKEKIEGLLGFNELQYLSMHFSNRVAEIVENGLNADGRIALTMKVPHPFNIVMGYKLCHQTNLGILHYNRREGKYIEPILLKEVFAT